MSVFNPSIGKCGPEITPYLDTFHTACLDCSDSTISLARIGASIDFYSDTSYYASAKSFLFQLYYDSNGLEYDPTKIGWAGRDNKNKLINF